MVDGKYTVLIIDDSGLMLRSMREFLKDEYDVRIAISGEVALKMLNKVIPDIILLDYEMPEMTGIEVFDEIRKLPEGKDIPIYFLTGVDDKAVIERLLAKQPAGYLFKPATQEKLHEIIRDELEKSN